MYHAFHSEFDRYGSLCKQIGNIVECESMDIIIILILLVVFSMIIAFVVRFIVLDAVKSQQISIEKTHELVGVTRQDLENLRSTVRETVSSTDQHLTTTMRETTEHISNQLSKANEVINDLKKEAGQFSEISRSMKEMQQFLQSPKLRGNIGEQVLTDMISQLFPKQQYSLQYVFANGQKVDVVIRTDAGLLPIDSKFQMEEFMRMHSVESSQEKEKAKREFLRSAKLHLDSIAKKYLLTNEGTLDFALMYIPSESVFYELLQDLNFMEHARRQRVYPVSPTSIYMYLQMILISNEGKKIAEKSKEILNMLRSIEREHSKVNSGFSVLGKHITNANNTYGTVAHGFTALGNTIQSARTIEGIPEPKTPLIKE